MGGFNFVCVADFIRVKRGFHRALRDFIEMPDDLRYNQFGKQELYKHERSENGSY